MLHALCAIGVRVGAQLAVRVVVADTVEGRADRVCGANGPRAVLGGFEDLVVRVVHGSARKSGLDGKRVYLVVVGGREGGVAVAARRFSVAASATLFSPQISCHSYP